VAERRAQRGARFAAAKFRPTTLPDSLVMRDELQHRLTDGASKSLTIVIGSAGAGKSVLLSSWESVRQPGTTSWLSCDEADANPVRFWAGSSRRRGASRPASAPTPRSCWPWTARCPLTSSQP
jgi:LuxR family maltose regulon positive regulatory protein